MVGDFSLLKINLAYPAIGHEGGENDNKIIRLGTIRRGFKFEVQRLT